MSHAMRMHVEFETPLAEMYQRNNRSGGQKSFRCFPACCVRGHTQQAFCGRTLQTRIRLELPADSETPVDPMHFLFCAYFRLDAAPTPATITLPAEGFFLEEMKLPAREDQYKTDYGGMRYADASVGSKAGRMTRPLDVTFNKRLSSWDYSWKSNRWSEDARHVIEILALHPLPAEESNTTDSDSSLATTSASFSTAGFCSSTGSAVRSAAVTGTTTSSGTCGASGSSNHSATQTRFRVVAACTSTPFAVVSTKHFKKQVKESQLLLSMKYEPQPGAVASGPTSTGPDGSNRSAARLDKVGRCGGGGGGSRDERADGLSALASLAAGEISRDLLSLPSTKPAEPTPALAPAPAPAPAPPMSLSALYRARVRGLPYNNSMNYSSNTNSGSTRMSGGASLSTAAFQKDTTVSGMIESKTNIFSSSCSTGGRTSYKDIARSEGAANFNSLTAAQLPSMGARGTGAGSGIGAGAVGGRLGATAGVAAAGQAALGKRIWSAADLSRTEGYPAVGTVRDAQRLQIPDLPIPVSPHRLSSARAPAAVAVTTTVPTISSSSSTSVSAPAGNYAIVRTVSPPNSLSIISGSTATAAEISSDSATDDSGIAVYGSESIGGGGIGALGGIGGYVHVIPLEDTEREVEEIGRAHRQEALQVRGWQAGKEQYEQYMDNLFCRIVASQKGQNSQTSSSLF